MPHSDSFLGSRDEVRGSGTDVAVVGCAVDFMQLS